MAYMQRFQQIVMASIDRCTNNELAGGMWVLLDVKEETSDRIPTFDNFHRQRMASLHAGDTPPPAAVFSP